MIKYSNYKLPHGLEYVGDGFTIRKTAHCSGKGTLEFMRTLCQHLIAHPDPMIVPVYSFEYLGQRAEHEYAYTYDMQRLGEISQEENNLIWQVGDAWRDGISNPARHHSLHWAWDKYPKLMSYLEEMIKLDRYHDLHGENILLDENAEYKIIDIEGFLNAPLSLPENDWITR